MSFKPFSYLRRGLRWSWNAVDATRRFFFNLIFLLIVVALLIAIFSSTKPVGPKTALVLELKGSLVEQHSGTVRDALVANASGEARRSVQLRDVLTVLDAAARDNNVASVVLLVDELEASGLASLHEVGAALDRFKASGKPVIAWGGHYDQRQYLLASHASEVYVHPMGGVEIRGFGRYRNYYRDALDKVGVTVNLIKVGAYKSAAEPFIGNGPSPQALEADKYLYGALWEGYTAEVEKQRKLKAGAVGAVIEDAPRLLEAAKGSLAQLALNAKLVDGLKTRDELRAMMIQRGAPDLEGNSFRQIGFGEYLASHRPAQIGDAVGVVIAQGEISDGVAPPGSIGGRSTAELIRKAREDRQVKAIVLRVNSPGGSAYGSELIRRELELARAAGKPVVVSMGDVAASGGYWISMASDEIVADPGTVTGSIGVFSLLPTADKVADKLGVHSAGVTTTWLADAYNPLRPLDPRFAQLMQSSVNYVYDEFTSKAAKARRTTQAKIDEVGQGRVWTGTQAKERGLVDTLGSYGDAIKSAARRAKLDGGYRVAYIERDSAPVERVLELLGADASAPLFRLQVNLGLLPQALPAGVVKDVARELGWLNELTEQRKPFTTITHCLCSPP
ncbi:MAG: signal peptide peptidase SppA [Gammaproteobacteria bacterium]